MLELVGGVRILLELVLGSALTGCVLAIDLVLEQEGVDIVICDRGTNMSAYASHAASRSRPQQQGSQIRGSILATLPSPCSRFASRVSPLNAARMASSVEARAPATSGTYFVSPRSEGVRSFRLLRVRLSDLMGARRRRCDSVSKPLTSRPSGLTSCSSPSAPRVTNNVPDSDSRGASSGSGGRGAGITSGSVSDSAM